MNVPPMPTKCKVPRCNGTFGDGCMVHWPNPLYWKCLGNARFGHMVFYNVDINNNPRGGTMPGNTEAEQVRLLVRLLENRSHSYPCPRAVDDFDDCKCGLHKRIDEIIGEAKRKEIVPV